MVNLFQDAVANFSPKHVSCIHREIPQSHDNKISRPFACFIIDRVWLKFKHENAKIIFNFLPLFLKIYFF